MEIRFNAQVASVQCVPGSLAEHARRRLRFRLREFSQRVAHVSVRLGHTGGRNGRQASYCVMQVQLHGAPAASVVAIGADAFDTIDRAADRVGRLAEAQLRVAVDAVPPSAREMAA